MNMIIQSMTGYGRGEDGNFKIETRSSNQRTLDIRINIPSYLYSLEPEIRKIVKEKFHRGRIEIFIPKVEEETAKLKINKSLAKETEHLIMPSRISKKCEPMKEKSSPMIFPGDLRH
jgi:uncharacterized protein (TIGR00255 family)